MEANVVILLTHKSIPTFKIEPFLSVLDSVSKVSKIQICSYKKKKTKKLITFSYLWLFFKNVVN